MGVPGLAPLIFRKYSDYVQYFSHGEVTTSTDYLHLDANGILHRSTQKVFNYGQGKRVLNPYQSLSYEEKVHKCFEMFFNDIKRLISVVQPIKVLYIALDGPPPYAKQMQQKQRRFVAAESGNEFNTSNITPGTNFSFELEKYMHYAIRKELVENPQLFNIEVVFSSQRNPGEGEHKLLDYIRNLPLTERKKKHCIFSPDGDLILLTMSICVTHQCNISLFREDQFNTDVIEKYHLIDISKICGTFNSKDEVLDFVFTSTFVGNDFAPKIKMFYYLRDGVELMSRLSIQLRRSNSPLFVNGKLNLKTFQLFLKEMMNREEKYLLQRVKEPCEYEYTTLTNNVVNGKLDFTNFRKCYYEKFGDNTSITDICSDYFKCLMWVFLYYTDTIPAWRYYYSYHYPPLMCDLYEYICQLTELPTFNIESSVTPIQSLFNVIPVKSSELLPEKLRHLLTEEEFELDKEGIQKEYQAIVKVSPISQPNTEVTNYKSKINTFSTVKVFKNSGKRSVFTSKFGVVKSFVECIEN